MIVLGTDLNNDGTGFLTELAFFMIGDETDYKNGLKFRRAYKDMIIVANPSAIRFMNVTGGNSDPGYRWSDRTLPTYWSFGGANQNILPYGTTTGGPAYSLAASSGGAPPSYYHGMIQATVGNPVGGAGFTISAITKSNPVQITATGNGFQVGEKVFFFSIKGMSQINNRTGNVQTAGDTFTVNIDSTGFSTFTEGKVSRAVGSVLGIHSISKASNAAVTFKATSPHSYRPGDAIVFTGAQGMNSINYRVGIVQTVTDNLKLTVDIDSSGFSAQQGGHRQRLH